MHTVSSMEISTPSLLLLLGLSLLSVDSSVGCAGGAASGCPGVFGRNHLDIGPAQGWQVMHDGHHNDRCEGRRKEILQLMLTNQLP